jgi:hypothetical protein
MAAREDRAMKTLILVDLDNVLRSTAWRLPCVDGRGCIPYRPDAHVDARFVRRDDEPLPDGGAVVVIAFNEETAAPRGDEPLRARYLLALAFATARMLDVDGAVRVEPVLVPTVPQAADLALVAALSRAPDASVSEGFTRVCLLSSDGGLQASVSATLGGGAVRQAPRVKLPCTRWVLAAPHQRAQPPASSPAGDSATWPEGYSAAVTQPNHVAAVAHERFVWDGSQEFSALAASSRRRVECLSVLGATRSSRRGVARLGDLLSNDDGTATLAPLSTDDGVELVGDAFAGGLATNVAPASTGAGAVSFPSLKATLPTRLPFAVVERSLRERTTILKTTTLDAKTLLYAFRSISAVCPMRVRCDVRSNEPRTARFAIEPVAGELSGWWFSAEGRGSATSECTVNLPPHWHFTPDVVDAELVVCGSQVDLAAPAIAELTVMPVSHGWEIVPVRTDEKATMVLIPGDTWLPRKAGPFRIKVERIQRVTFARWDLDEVLWSRLRRLPLLVPCQEARAMPVHPVRASS